MIDILLQYGLFLAQAVTVVAAIGATMAIAAALSRRGASGEHLEVKRLNDRYVELRRVVQRQLLSRKEFKAEQKARKKRDKAAVGADRKRVFVLEFHGDLRATAVASLREEVTALLSMARPRDEVLLKLENGGGLVHEHGLAAAQLMRLRARDIPLTICVDRVAASGGYMMACVGNRILAAPFAVLGSIGVLLQLPNFHRFLDARGIDFEMIKGGEFKRSLTVFGENTEADREKMRDDIELTHALFKSFVSEQRPGLAIDIVSTGEHWYGTRALALGLCDELGTSDDYLLAASEQADLYGVRFVTKKPLAGRLAMALGSAFDQALARLAGVERCAP